MENTLATLEKPDFSKMISKSLLSASDLLGEILVFGDIHGSDRRSKIHVNYEEDTIYVFTYILKMVRERKPKAVILAGDLIGLHNDKNVKTLQFQAFIHMTLKLISDEVNGELYLVWGNHDEGATLTDTQYFAMTGVLKHTDHIDLGLLRVHLVNYGEDNRQLDIRDGAYNVVVAHSEFRVGRQTSWYFNSSKAVELSTMMNFKGVDLVLCGHIHNPSPYPITTSIGDKNTTLVYLGCPTRPRITDNYNHVHVASLVVKEGQVSHDLLRWDLPPDRFVAGAEQSELEAVLDDMAMLNVSSNVVTKRQQDLSEALGSLADYGLMGGAQDFIACLKAIGVMDKEALELVLEKLASFEGGNKALGANW